MESIQNIEQTFLFFIILILFLFAAFLVGEADSLKIFLLFKLNSKFTIQIEKIVLVVLF